MKKIVVAAVVIIGGGLLWYELAYAPATSSDIPSEEEPLVEGQIKDEGDRESPQELLWTWQWIETTYSGVEKVRSENPQTFQITFQADETFTATTDCNAVSGSFEIYDSQIVFGPFAMTKRACSGETQQDLFVGALSEVDMYRTEGDTLMLYNDMGLVMIFRAVE